ncbi:hypothetical protein LNP74_27970 [Klebsiella pneumoniae subsp. pneumoniae]|nr:hypothetical protein [Klebsiella pneumoniae subsp. pneumoniae]
MIILATTFTGVTGRHAIGKAFTRRCAALLTVYSSPSSRLFI